MQHSQHLGGARLSTSSHSSTNNTLLNGLLPIHRLSQSPSNTPLNASPNQSRPLTNSNQPLKRSEQLRNLLLSVVLTFLLAFLLLVTIELSSILVKPVNANEIFFLKINSTTHFNQSEIDPIRSFFACVWFYNLLLFVSCLCVHLIAYQRRSQRSRARAALLREFGRIFVNGKLSSSNTLVDYLVKTCLLCLLWYFSCYLLFRSMSILVSSQIIILYSITITLRQVLGWIFLHEQFIGNKIIAHILALSALLFLAHNDGFRFNRFLLGLTMVASSVAMKSIFDILINGFVKDLTTLKLRIVMINISLCGTCLLWPFALLFHMTKIESISTEHFHSVLCIFTFLCALLFNLLTITLPFQYTRITNAASVLLVIPSISLIDHYMLNVKYSPLVLSAIFCSFGGVLLSMVPQQWLQGGEGTKMKQALGLLNKDSTSSGVNAALLANLGATTGTSSAFEEIRAQRRIRNALLFNEMKS